MTDRDADLVLTEVVPGDTDEVHTPLPDDERADPVSRGGCLTELQGWAGAHLHGAVRPRRRAAGRGRPPGRWC